MAQNQGPQQGQSWQGPSPQPTQNWQAPQPQSGQNWQGAMPQTAQPSQNGQGMTSQPPQPNQSGQGMTPPFQGGGGFPQGYPGYGTGMPSPQMQGGMGQGWPSPSPGTGMPTPPTQQVREQSYIENILRQNAGKTATIYMTFENNQEWNAKVFRGEIEAAGRDHVVISDRKTGMRYLLPLIYLDYVTFQGPINYTYPIEPQTGD